MRIGSHTPLALFHQVIQVSMGWADKYLHRFRIHGQNLGLSYAGGQTFNHDANTQREQLSHQSLFIDQLLEQIKLAKHHRFGVKSEHISPDQLRLLLDEEQKNNPDDRVDIDDDVADQPETATPTKKSLRGAQGLGLAP